MLCSGTGGEKIGRDLAGWEMRHGRAIIHAMLPIVVSVLGGTGVLVVLIVWGFLVTRLVRLGGAGAASTCYFR